MSYSLLKFLHILGVVLLIGNVTVTSVWKVFADRTGSPLTVAFAQRLVTHTDWAFTLGGVLLIMVGGYGMALSSGISLWNTGWLLWGQILFALSGLIWVLVLIPIQTAQSRLAAKLSAGGEIGAAYRRLSRLWLFFGILATVPLVFALHVMVTKAL
jgi:uncharacterized membrane protein